MQQYLEACTSVRVKRLVLFLASDSSRMMTGQCMVVDGGAVHTG